MNEQQKLRIVELARVVEVNLALAVGWQMIFETTQVSVSNVRASIASAEAFRIAQESSHVALATS